MNWMKKLGLQRQKLPDQEGGSDILKQKQAEQENEPDILKKMQADVDMLLASRENRDDTDAFDIY